MHKPARIDSASQIMTVEEVAGYLRLSTATIYKLAQGNKIPAKKIGRTWRFSRQLVDAWVREQAILPGPTPLAPG